MNGGGGGDIMIGEDGHDTLVMQGVESDWTAGAGENGSTTP